MLRTLQHLIARWTGRRGAPGTDGHPDPAAVGAPLHTDWACWPEPWRARLEDPVVRAAASGATLGREVKLFHDGTGGQVDLVQMASSPAEDSSPPHAVAVETRDFDGSFVSLVIELPEPALKGLERRHIVRLEARAELARPAETFARLNVRNGPNIEQIVREVPVSSGAPLVVEFDLAYTKMNPRRVDAIWLDLIFEGTGTNRIVLRGLCLSRRPRLEV